MYIHTDNARLTHTTSHPPTCNAMAPGVVLEASQRVALSIGLYLLRKGRELSAVATVSQKRLFCRAEFGE